MTAGYRNAAGRWFPISNKKVFVHGSLLDGREACGQRGYHELRDKDDIGIAEGFYPAAVCPDCNECVNPYDVDTHVCTIAPDASTRRPRLTEEQQQARYDIQDKLLSGEASGMCLFLAL